MSCRRYRVLIIGAGVAGLTAGIALHRTGHEVLICERQPQVKPLGAGLILWSNAVSAFRSLGIESELLNIGHRLSHLAILDQDGRVLSGTDAGNISNRVGSATVAVNRGDLIPLLLECLPPGSLVTGRNLESFEQSSTGVAAHFPDGHTEQGDLLIGADGIWSRVRSQIHGEQKARYSGYTAWRAIASIPDPSGHGTDRSTESWGSGLRFGWVPLIDNRVYWFAVKNAPEGQLADIRGHRGELLDLFGDWHSPIRETIEATAEHDILRHDIYDRAPISNWGTRLVTLAGDAAHPMTPNTGQGAAQAIEDAVVLADCLDRYVSIDGALRSYERQRIPRTRMVADLSRRIGTVAQINNPIGVRARDLVARLIPDNVGARQIESVVSWSPPRLREVERDNLRQCESSHRA